MGRSRGGLTTKIHALVDACGLPIVLKLTEGQAHDGRSAADMLDSIKAGNILLADRAYDSNALRDWLEQRGAWGNIRAMPHRLKPPAFSKWLYRQLNRPGFTGGYFVQMSGDFIKDVHVCIEGLLCFLRCNVIDCAVQAFGVVPVDPFQGFPFNLAHGFPRAEEVDDFGFK